MKKAKLQLKTKNFKTAIYEVVKKISKRQVLTYKKVSQLAGMPRAWRAVGNILNKNRDSKVPCHRVIKSDGKIGGYNQGIKKKIALLMKEGVKIENKRVIF